MSRKHKKYTKEEQISVLQKVCTFIEILTGRYQYIRKNEAKRSITITSGIKELLKHIYSRGDCGRLALIVYHRFKQYNPKIYCISWKEPNYKEGDELCFHFVTKIFNKYFDVKGMFDGPLQENFQYPITVELVTEEWMARSPLGDYLYGNFLLRRLPYEVYVQNCISDYSITLNLSDVAHPICKGYNHDTIHLMMNLFKKLTDDKMSVSEWLDYCEEVNGIRYRKDLQWSFLKELSNGEKYAIQNEKNQ